MKYRRICKDLCSVHEARQSVQVLHVLRRGESWLIVLTEAIHSSVVIYGHDQRGRRVCLPMIKSSDPLPRWRNLKVRVTNDNLVGVTIGNLGKQKFSTAGLMNDLLLAIPGGL